MLIFEKKFVIFVEFFQKLVYNIFVKAGSPHNICFKGDFYEIYRRKSSQDRKGRKQATRNCFRHNRGMFRHSRHQGY